MNLSQDLSKILAVARLRPRAQRRWTAALDGAVYLALLEREGWCDDACRLLPFLMTPRQAIWWGCLCAWHVGPVRPEPEEAALAAALRWVAHPEPRASGAPRRRRPLRTPAGCLAAAADWAATPDTAPLLPARLVLAAVMLAAVERAPMQFADRCRDFLAIGTGVARGTFAFPEPAARNVETAVATPIS